MNDDLVRAARELAVDRDRLVVRPSVDNGCFLIDTDCCHPRSFDDITWSTPAVLDRTLERADELGLTASLLPPWYDVERRRRRDGALRQLSGPGASSPSAAAST